MKLLYKFLGMLLGVLLVACEHKDFCYHHPHDARVRIEVDWSRFKVEQPTGMTVMVYDQEDGGERLATQLTNTITHAEFLLPEGLYRSIVFNQSLSEFGSLSFRGLDNYHTAEVYAIPATNTRWYVNRGEDTRVVTEPEWLGTSCNEDMLVTEAMVNQTTEERHNASSRALTRNSFPIGSHVVQNVIYIVDVTVHIKGIYNLRAARASLSGLAEGYLMGQARPNGNTVVQLLEEWSIKQDTQDPTQGSISSRIACFGLPHGHEGMPEENLFELEVLLVDNKTRMKFPFYVGDRFERNIEEDVYLSLSLELTLDDPLPDVKPENDSGSGFSAEVDDWGPEENIDINM